ncbi:MAG: S46 family peptidase [Bacteroidales bacterium]
MKKFNLLLIGIFAIFTMAQADEGMWIPGHISKMNYTDMQKLGLKLSPEEIYSINNSSLKDAIFQLLGEGGQGFCTGEMVSDKGLLFTNHHCGYEAIANLSSTETNYLDDGYWAKSLEEEIPVPGVSVSRVVRIDNVTEKVLEGVDFDTDESERDKLIKKHISTIEEEAMADNDYKANVKEMYLGGEYYLFVYEEFGDVRFVGAPPSSIGKFGGDTDNWMWPRHTGDFSVFRVYMSPDGDATGEYEEDNIPYKPLHHLPVSIKGVKEGDFTMIMGYPGQTERYLTDAGMKYKMNTFDPMVVRLLGTKLEIMEKYMDADKELRLELADEYASLANGHKMFKGEAENLRNTDAIERRTKLQEEFMAWVNTKEERKAKYADVVSSLDKDYQEFAPVTEEMIYISLGLLQSSDKLMYVQQFKKLQKLLEDKKDNAEDIEESSERLKNSLDSHFDNYHPDMDREILEALMKAYADGLDEEQQIDFFTTVLPEEYKTDNIELAIEEFIEDVYENSIFTSRERMTDFLEKPKGKTLEKDPMVMLFDGVYGSIMSSQGSYVSMMNDIEVNERKFIAGLREFQSGKAFYPDANSTLRLTYGKVKDYDPEDAVHYEEMTYIEGIMEKWDPDDKEFQVPEKLVELYNAKDYGRYADETGSLPVCFISDNDITGGNSGSPILNGNGELVGLAFDGNWEWLCSNLIYNPELQRTINVDSRYVLWVIEKIGGATNIIEELDIIE